MTRLLGFRVFAALLIATSVALSGCGGEAPTAGNSAKNEDGQPESVKQKLVGAWAGTMQLDEAQVLAKLTNQTEAQKKQTIASLKSARMEITFEDSGQLKLISFIDVPDGVFQDTAEASWKVVRQEGPDAVIQSQESGGQPEEIMIRFESDDSFSMRPKRYASIGSMHFTKKR